MTVTDEQEIARYVERVRQALADLPPAVRDELVEDLPEHLAEVAAEGTGSLVDRLGSPEAYAAELRAAAGVGAPPGARNLDDRISAAVVKARGRLQALDAKAGPLIGYAKASDFLRLLRPAWWVLRGYLVAMLVTAMTSVSFGLLPRFDNSVVAGLLLLAVTVVGSIWLGRRSSGFTRWPRLAVHAATVLLLLFGLAGFVEANQRSSVFGGSDYYPAVYNPNPYENVQDVYVYDREGRLVEGARLFDQNGQPIRLGYPWCPESQQVLGDPVRQAYPYCPQGAPFRFPVPAPTAEPSPPATPLPTPSGATPTATPLPTPTPTAPQPATTR